MKMFQERDDLPLVMAEITGAMSARGTVLTIHPEDDRRPSILYADEKVGLTHGVIDRLLDGNIVWDETTAPEHRWVSCEVDQNCGDILLIPVAKTEGHSRLVITVYFDHMTRKKRAIAESVYRRRAPFAVGYFRLWQLARTRQREAAAMKAALNLSEMGIMLISQSGDLAFANHAASSLLDGGDGLRRRNGSVRAAHLRDSVRLQMALEQVIAANGADPIESMPDRHAPIFKLNRKDGSPLIVSVMPTEERAVEPSDVAAIIYVIDPARNVQQLLRPICKIYALSPVETQLACLLCTGDSLTQVAEKMRIKEMTARSYLKQIFTKTNTHRQTKLVQAMLSSVIGTAPTVVPEPF